jgi:hypothetical protein
MYQETGKVKEPPTRETSKSSPVNMEQFLGDDENASKFRSGPYGTIMIVMSIVHVTRPWNENKA